MFKVVEHPATQLILNMKKLLVWAEMVEDDYHLPLFVMAII